MRLDNIIATATDHLVGRLLRRAQVAVVMGTCAIIALYHHDCGQYHAHRPVRRSQHAADHRRDLRSLALISLMILWAMRAKPAKLAGAPALSNPREMQLVMLVEAVMLGFALAQKGERAR
jgi:hypothetical protein